MEIVYLETTISSYLVARPSRDLVLAAHQELTREWWETERGRYHCIVSAEVLREASMGDAEMSRQRLTMMTGMPVVAITPQIERMAVQFLETGALPAEMRSDALHLAAASLAGADYLLTWNCRHLANAQILRRLEGEAKRLGWELPKVCTPLELVGGSPP